MKHVKTLLLFVVMTLPVLQSCQKDDYLTSAEQKGVELQKVCASKNVSTANALTFVYSDNTWYSEAIGNFEIKGSYITMGTHYYSLDSLFKYDFLTTQNGVVLLLYFR